MKLKYALYKNNPVNKQKIQEDVVNATETANHIVGSCGREVKLFDGKFGISRRALAIKRGRPKQLDLILQTKDYIRVRVPFETGPDYAYFYIPIMSAPLKELVSKALKCCTLQTEFDVECLRRAKKWETNGGNLAL